jgi:hypothetical protein
MLASPRAVVCLVFSTKNTWVQFTLMPSKYLISEGSLKMSVKERKVSKPASGSGARRSLCAAMGHFLASVFLPTHFLRPSRACAQHNKKIQAVAAAARVPSSGEN